MTLFQEAQLEMIVRVSRETRCLGVGSRSFDSCCDARRRTRMARLRSMVRHVLSSLHRSSACARSLALAAPCSQRRSRIET